MVSDEFRNAYGTGTRYRAFGSADRERLASTVPAFILDLWEADGWAGYRDGLFWTCDPQEYEPVVAAWKIPESPLLVVARTALGKLYLLGSFKTQSGGSAHGVLGLNPHTGDYSFVGQRAEKFLTISITKEDYITEALQEPEAKRAAKAVGPLAWDEMYGYEPALALGGSGKPDTVRRYNIFNHQILLSQLVAAKLRKF
jgi:hypothetical protein